MKCPSKHTRARFFAALGLSMLSSCGGGKADPGDDSIDRALLFVIDTLRADDAYDAQLAPNIHAWAETGVRFEQAYASASYTLASTASLFTGLRPAAHANLGQASNVLQPAQRTLAEALASAGIATGAFSCNPHISRPGGFDQGFEAFGFYGRDDFDTHRVPDALLEDLQLWWTEDSERPQFAYVHVLPPHAPYQPPSGFGDRGAAASIDKRLGLQTRLDELNAAGPLGPNAPEIAQLRTLYRAAVSYVDTWFAEALQAVSVDDVGVLLTSDHGEGFMEHGRVSHGFAPNSEQVRVPLILGWPGLPARRVTKPVETRDLAATLCAALGAEWPERGFGKSVWSALAQGGPWPESEGILSRSMGSRPAWGWRLDNWLLIEQPAADSSALYDVDADPGERIDRSAEQVAVLEAMRAELGRALERDARQRVPIDGPRSHSVFAKELAELGYLTNASAGERTSVDNDD